MESKREETRDRGPSLPSSPGPEPAQAAQQQQQHTIPLSDIRPNRVGLRRKPVYVGPAPPAFDAAPSTAPIGSGEKGLPIPDKIPSDEIEANGGEAPPSPTIRTSGLLRAHPDQYQKSPPPDETAPESPAAYTRTWSEYSAWRKTKCPPPEFHAAVYLDELDQAIHEFVGEVAELCEKLVGSLMTVMDGDGGEVADEIGDCLFTASWVADCLDENFLGARGAIQYGFLNKEQTNELTNAHREFYSGYAAKKNAASLPGFSAWAIDIQSTLLSLSACAGKLCNCFKKARWHHVPQDPAEMLESLFHAFMALDAICCMLGLGFAPCAEINRRKLERRFPNGWAIGGGKR